MAILTKFEPFFLRVPQGFRSRLRIGFYKLLGLKSGGENRMEKSRCRRLQQIVIGKRNAFSQGIMLWPEDKNYDGIRIKIGDHNYFNRNLMIDAGGYVEIGNYNMVGPDVYITDSNHTFGRDLAPNAQPMQKGTVKIGSYCWLGAKAVILKDVSLGDYCVVAAGAVVTKSFSEGSVIAGVPAKLLRNINENT